MRSIAAIRPSAMPISAMPSRPETGSITRPPRSSRSNLVSIAMSLRVVGMPVRSMLTPSRMVQAERAPDAGDRAWRGYRPVRAAPGGRPLSARQGRVHRRHPAGRHAGARLRAQPASRMRASAPSANRPAPQARCSLRRTSSACSRSSRSPGCRASSRRCSRCWRPTRCAMSARRSRCASPPSRAEAEDLAAAVEVDFDELPAVVDMLRTRMPARRWCMSTGTTTFSWRPSSRSRRALRGPAGADRRARDGCAPRGSACRRWKAAASWRRGTGGWNSCWSTPRPRCRTSCAPGSPGALGWTRRASASSHPMSAAASATRASCCRRRSALRIWRAGSAGRCAGSRTGASSSPATPTAASTTTTSRSTPKPTAR